MDNISKRERVWILCVVLFCAVLLLVSAAAASNTASITITGVYLGVAPPVAAFTAVPSSGHYPLTVTFTDTSTGGTPDSWAWEYYKIGSGPWTTFGTGAPIESFTFSTSGTYTIRLTVSKGAGSSSATRDIIVYDPLTAAITATQDCTTKLKVKFTGTSTGGPDSGTTTWAWDFNNDLIVDFQGPGQYTYTYANAGTYTAKLTVTKGAESSTVTKTIIPGTLTASFTYTPPNPIAKQDVTFTDTSKGIPISWKWEWQRKLTTKTWTVWTEFGNGAQNPSYPFDPSGTYNVRLTPKNSCPSSCTPSTKTITIKVAPPVACFSGTILSKTAPLSVTLTESPGDTPLSGTAPLLVAFTDLSDNTPTSWKWEYRTATTGWTQFATTQNPTVSFPPGTFSISLTATNAGGSGSITSDNYITVTAPPAPVASFSGTPLSGTAPLSVTFTDSSTNTPISWAWGAKNLTPGNNTWFKFSDTKNPSQTFGFGNWSINLTATNAGGSNISTQVTWVNVSAPFSCGAGAYSAWSELGTAWKKTNDVCTVVMWDTTGTTTWTVPAGVTSVEYLVIAGGGGGAGMKAYSNSYGAGGGGAGGYKNATGFAVSGSYTVTVGAGGTQGTNAPSNGGNGGNSVFGSITATGGGGGATASTSTKASGLAGGSGGGGAGGSSGGGAGGAGTAGQGNNGGTAAKKSGGGGGGAGAVGGASTDNKGGTGGNGKIFYITGEALTYAGGGGGGSGGNSLGGGAGGSGGGGAGGAAKQNPGVNAAFYGSGGGGGTSSSSTSAANQKGGAGYRGVVIVRYRTP